MRVMTGVIEIGRKSACCVAGSFGTGWVEADFHCVGMVEVLRDRLKSLAIGSVEFYLYPTVGTVLIHSVKPELTE